MMNSLSDGGADASKMGIVATSQMNPNAAFAAVKADQRKSHAEKPKTGQGWV